MVKMFKWQPQCETVATFGGCPDDCVQASKESLCRLYFVNCEDKRLQSSWMLII